MHPAVESLHTLGLRVLSHGRIFGAEEVNCLLSLRALRERTEVRGERFSGAGILNIAKNPVFRYPFHLVFIERSLLQSHIG